MPYVLDSQDMRLKRNGVLFMCSTQDDGDMRDRNRDDKEMRQVLENRKQFFAKIGFPEKMVERMHMAPQHTDKVYEVSEPGMRKCDGLTTRIAGLPLTLSTGDCFPVLMFDKARRVLALLHCGWRGVDYRLPIQLLTRCWSMEKRSQALEEVIVAFGPGICRNCYRVEEPQQLDFLTDEPLRPRDHWLEFIEENDEGGYLVDLLGCMARDLFLYGIPWENILNVGICTYEHPELFFSHRRGQQKRFMNVAILF